MAIDSAHPPPAGQVQRSAGASSCERRPMLQHVANTLLLDGTVDTSHAWKYGNMTQKHSTKFIILRSGQETLPFGQDHPKPLLFGFGYFRGAYIHRQL
jgi:hypothetical protein